MSEKKSYTDPVEISAILTVIGVIILFSASIIVVLIAPSYVDPSWTQPTTPYQVQMYEVSDPNVYISSTQKGRQELQFVYHLKNDYTLLAFQESDTVKIVTTPDLEKYITKNDENKLKLTARLLLLREPQGEQLEKSREMRQKLQSDWEQKNPKGREEGLVKPDFSIYELYDPAKSEAFSLGPTEGILENWVNREHFTFVEGPKQEFHKSTGVIYVLNPVEYRISKFKQGDVSIWRYDPNGKPIESLAELKGSELGFSSRAELIAEGEHIYAIEGCWYCHTDQTRTLIQDTVLNGSDSYPAPPSSANEYVYQNITFPGTRRIGPDLSRVAIKRPSRDWHKGHFWSPKTASAGSIMPSFRHFFDDDPRGTGKSLTGVPNYRFEAIFQYLMTKGSRITPPTEAWWLGKDPVQTIAIIEGLRKPEVPGE